MRAIPHPRGHDSGRRTAPCRSPGRFRGALTENATAAAKFVVLSPFQRKEYAGWIEDAKRPETRTKRIAQAVEMIAAGEKRNKTR
ncbi:MAG: YdeI/OmpD-associated family protein [Chloroflexota bacterium]|nr:YdeI/OmpD-associated family protein [Chloroflexota bacterium]